MAAQKGAPEREGPHGLSQVNRIYRHFLGDIKGEDLITKRGRKKDELGESAVHPLLLIRVDCGRKSTKQSEEHQSIKRFPVLYCTGSFQQVIENSIVEGMICRLHTLYPWGTLLAHLE